MTESEPTHRVVRGPHRRSSDDAGPATVYGTGDRITPTERELERFPAKFERLDDADMSDDDAPTDENDESAASSDAGADTSETPDGEADAESADESDENEATGEGPAPEPLTEAWVEAADYNGLRSAAGRFDDVNGNWGEDRLRAELLERAE